MEIFIAFLALFVSSISIIIAWYSVYKSTKMTLYTYLAEKWYDIKEIELDNPDFIDSNKTSSYKTCFTGDLLRKYETFAFICWAHAEDMYLNKWHKDIGFAPTLNWYKKLHFNWLSEPENRKYFNSSFMKYINEVKD